ncbi:exosome nuclease subunit [Aspergillus hancockii]|nr:exosome nuclease subunit [Aspergillus hancockii]
MDSAADFPPFQQRLTSSLVQMTRTVGQLSAEDLSFHRSSNAELSESLDEQSSRILSLTSSLLKAATAGTDLPAPSLEDEDSIEDNWRGMVDVIDALLERADACLDEFTGVIKKLSPSQQEQGAAKAAKKATTKFPTIYDYGPSKIPKPQLQFEHQVDNTDVSPFKPLLKTKPHAIVPLEESVESTDPTMGLRNPYETEIRAAKYPESTYTVSPPVPYQSWESTTATFVDTLEGVEEMLNELKAAKEIAIDLEHHDVHSYHGLVSLMQISTRDKDWVVDTLKPWREELQMLNEVFADPAILKVLHGSSMDMIWLQRDLGLYVVGMFDTYHAACALSYPKRSLKFLLQKFVNFEADKRYQMADWRIRPLPEGMFDYARSDTHYLLHIFDHLRNELVQNSIPENNLVDHVLEQSKNEALQRYERPVYDAATGQGPGGWYDYLSRNPAVLSKEQFAVFKAVHQWRDEVAREEDEGVQCVFPKHILFKVAHAMPLDFGTLFRTLSPVTPITKDRASDLLEIIKNAKVEGANGPEWRDVYVKPTKAGRATPATETEQGLLTPSTDDETIPTAARCEVSQFWGAVLESREPLTPLEYSTVASAEALRLSLPLPPMPRTVSEACNKLADSTTAKPPPPKPATAPTEAPKNEDENKVFTVKGLGGPRKRKSEQAHSPEADDADSLIDIGEKPSKKQRRKEKKNKSASQTPQPEESKEEDEPFNYDTAVSVLHAQPVQTATRPSKRPFNPYAKALEAPSGVRKQKRETPGKSLTFR